MESLDGERIAVMNFADLITANMFTHLSLVQMTISFL